MSLDEQLVFPGVLGSFYEIALTMLLSKKVIVINFKKLFKEIVIES